MIPRTGFPFNPDATKAAGHPRGSKAAHFIVKLIIKPPKYFKKMQIDDILQVLPLFLNHSNAAVAIKDIDGCYLFANSEFSRYADKPWQEINGHCDADFQIAEYNQKIQDIEQSAISLLRGVSCDEEFSRDGNTVYYLSTRFPILDELQHVIGIGIVAMDVTAQHQSISEAEQALCAAEQMNAQLRLAVASLEQLASTDRLTNAWNRRRFEEAVESEIHRFHRYGHPLSLMMLDIDHFKKVNDTYGHQEGDRVLKQVAERIFASIRKSDSLTRWGGEEFIVLTPNTGLAYASILAERIRANIAIQAVGDVGTVTVSIGVAEYFPTSSSKDWLERADRAMYTAKREGRNRIEIDATVGNAPIVAEHFEGHFVQLVWKNAFLSGNELIDTQHQGLFRVANELLDAVLSGRPSDEVSLIVSRLLSDVVRHFEDEEAILAALSFPGLAEHAGEHARLVAKALELADAFKTGVLSVGSLFQFLAYDVVTRHMLGADREYFPYTAA